MSDEHLGPVCRVEMEYENGTRCVLDGEAAEDWAQWVEGGVGLAVAHGATSPDVSWEVLDDE